MYKKNIAIDSQFLKMPTGLKVLSASQQRNYLKKPFEYFATWDVPDNWNSFKSQESMKSRQALLVVVVMLK